MHFLDWIVLGVYFLLLIGIGAWAYFKVKNSSDFFTAGGKLPWWLSGVSHHVSGYSGAVFVAYAGIAYTHGVTLYFWWACTVAIGTLAAALLIAPKWVALRRTFKIQSPTEYLLRRYNLPTQQLIAWIGSLIKVFDTGGKLAAIAVLLNVFSGASITVGILLVGLVSLIYITIGGLWADVWNDFAQFIVQLIAGITMFVYVLIRLGDGFNGVWTLWEKLPEDHLQLLNEPYTLAFALAMLFINFFSYSGGTWNLATRFISSSDEKTARKAGILSSFLYLTWPVILLFPMFAAPIFFPELEDPKTSYGRMALEFLPTGLVGLVLASMFANTLSMTSSDSNTVSAVISRDILPVLFPKLKGLDAKKGLFLARITTFFFTILTLIVAFNAHRFGGVFGLIVAWFAALLGPIAVPVILGLIPAFRRSGSTAALISIIGGILMFVITKVFAGHNTLAVEMATPILTSVILYLGIGWIWPDRSQLTDLKN